jgi:hypothetical protein
MRGKLLLVAATCTLLAAGCTGAVRDSDEHDGETDGETAQALNADGVFKLEAAHSGKCLDVSAASQADGGNVQQWQCSDVPNQEFEIEHLGNGVHRIIAAHSGKCLDVYKNGASNGTNVQQWKCHGKTHQQWQIVEAGADEYQLKAVHSGQCLDVSKAGRDDGANVQTWQCANVAQQKFRLVRVDAPGGPETPLSCGAFPPPARAGQWQSSKVKVDGAGRLSYPTDGAKNRIVDFSYAGYHAGLRALPNVPTVSTLGPVSGDNTRRIQDALDAVGKRAPDAQGFRGAVQLSPGRYEVNGTLRIAQSGVVLRGSGSGSDTATNTVLIGKGDTPHQRRLVVVGTNNGNPWKAGAATNVRDAFVPVGATRLDVDNPGLFKAGSDVLVRHPSSQKWIDALGGGGAKTPWSAGSKDIVYVRRVLSVNGNTLELDAPIYNHLDRTLTQSTVAQVSSRSLISEAGLENLRIDIETRGGEDENHVWDAVGVVGCEDCWVRGLSVLHFGHAAVFTSGARRITVSEVRATAPVAIRTGGRMYNFDAEGYSQLVLFTRCHAEDGRHNFIANGTMTASGVVFHRSTESGASTSEGHRHFSQALLFDAIDAKSGSIALINRGDYGTQHGWGAAHSVVWNYNKSMQAQKPPTAQNYAISRSGSVSTKNPFAGAQGHHEIRAGELVPESLYDAQLCNRLSP